MTKREVVNHGKEQWIVDWGEDEMGRRMPKFHPSETDGDKAIGDYNKEQKRCGEYRARLNPGRRGDNQLAVVLWSQNTHEHA